MKTEEFKKMSDINLSDDELLVIVGGYNENEQVPYNCGLGCGNGCGSGCGSCTLEPVEIPKSI